MSGSRVFVSYSRVDRARVAGLGALLEALGHEVFLDHKTIKLGSRWEAELQTGLDEAEVLLVFWTKHAARSEWVRREHEHFRSRFPDRPLVPLRGDETELGEPLSAYQGTDFAPLVNDLLQLQRGLRRDGISAREIHKAVRKRLAEAGVDLDENQRKSVMALFAPVGLLGLLASPSVFLKSLGDAVVEAAAQLSGAQTMLFAGAMVSGVVVGTVLPDPSPSSCVLPQTDITAIVRHLEEADRLLSKRDWKAWSELLTPDAVFLGYNGLQARGRRENYELQKKHQMNLEILERTYKILEIGGCGNMGYVLVEGSASYDSVDSPDKFSGRDWGLVVLAKQSTGEWLSKTWVWDFER